MELTDVIEALSRIPRDFRERGDVSVVSLLKESGYVERFNQIIEKDLAGHFQEHPDLVQVWLHYSEDQRCSPAWYFLPPGDSFSGLKGWAVGYYPECRHREFQDGAEACAHYVKRWAESVRSNIDKTR